MHPLLPTPPFLPTPALTENPPITKGYSFISGSRPEVIAAEAVELIRDQSPRTLLIATPGMDTIGEFELLVFADLQRFGIPFERAYALVIAYTNRAQLPEELFPTAEDLIPVDYIDPQTGEITPIIPWFFRKDLIDFIYNSPLRWEDENRNKRQSPKLIGVPNKEATGGYHFVDEILNRIYTGAPDFNGSIHFTFLPNTDISTPAESVGDSIHIICELLSNKLKSIKSIPAAYRGDWERYIRDLVEQLLLTLNSSSEAILNILRKQLTLTSNLELVDGNTSVLFLSAIPGVQLGNNLSNLHDFNPADNDIMSPAITLLSEYIKRLLILTPHLATEPFRKEIERSIVLQVVFDTVHTNAARNLRGKRVDLTLARRIKTVSLAIFKRIEEATLAGCFDIESLLYSTIPFDDLLDMGDINMQLPLARLEELYLVRGEA